MTDIMLVWESIKYSISDSTPGSNLQKADNHAKF